MTSSALAICLVTAPAAFSLTPDEVWNGWVTYYNTMGYKLVEGSREQAGEVLTVKDVVLNQDSPESKVTMTLGQVVLTGTGDGNVRTTMADAIPVHIEVTEDDKPVVVDMTIKMPGAEIISSGGPDARTDRMSAKTATVSVDKILTAPDAPAMADVATITASDFTSQTVTHGAKGYTGTGGASKLDYTVNIAGEDGDLKGGGSIEKVAVNADITLPPSGTVVSIEENLGKALREGMKISGKLTTGPGKHDLDYTGKAEDGATTSGKINATGEDASVAFTMASDGLAYQGSSARMQASVTDSQLPAPVTYTLDRAAFDLMVPITKSDTPQPFKLTYALNGLALGDGVWALADPDKKLPRTPANIEFDVTGKALVAADLLDPEAMKASVDPAPAKDTAPVTPAPATPDAAKPDAAKPDAAKPDSAKPDAAPEAATPGTAPAPAGTDTAADSGQVPDTPSPFQPVELAINKLLVDAVGAKISADGMLKGANGGTLETPVGTLHAKMEGVNKLIDTLVAMGVVPEQQVQGYRMMLAMFTKTTEGSDVMTSDIEFREDGSILANGQQIK